MGDLCVDANIILIRILINNVKIDFNETGYEREEWIQLVYDMSQLRVTVRGNEPWGGLYKSWGISSADKTLSISITTLVSCT
jgi:hypothetical protein